MKLLQMAGGRTLDLSEPRVMGVLNITPDSFNDGGRFMRLESALGRARVMVLQGAAIIDIGGESTRPGSTPVSEAEELDRVMPVIEAVADQLDVAISVDTSKPGVMSAALAAGAHMVNDVRALGGKGALDVIAGSEDAAICLMHMLGEQRSMQEDPHYDDVVAEVRAFLAQRVQACIGRGIGRDRIVIDPGIGFGKSLDHNLALLSAVDQLAADGVPVLIGASRKSMFHALLGTAAPGERVTGSVVAAGLAVWQGAAIVRAHDVRETVQAVRVAQAMRAAKEST
jgi:dihydropteroate synthase